MTEDDIAIALEDADELDDPTAAEAALRGVLAHCEALVAPSPYGVSTMGYVRKALASRLIARGALDDAEAVLTPIVPASSLLADIYEQRGDPARSERALRDVVARSGGVTDAVSSLDGLERFLRRQGRHDDADAVDVQYLAALDALAAIACDAFYRPDARPPSERLRAGITPVDWMPQLHACRGIVTTGRALEPDGTPVIGGPRCFRIFGPARDFECACGSLRGREHWDERCKSCGVDVLPTAVRRVRTGRIDLGRAFIHPRWRTAVLAIADASEADVLADPDAWDHEPWKCTDRELANQIEDRAVRTGMMIDSVVVWPADRPLPTGVERETLEARYGDVIDAVATGEVRGIQAAIDRLFAVFG